MKCCSESVWTFVGATDARSSSVLCAVDGFYQRRNYERKLRMARGRFCARHG